MIDVGWQVIPIRQDVAFVFQRSVVLGMNFQVPGACRAIVRWTWAALGLCAALAVWGLIGASAIARDGGPLAGDDARDYRWFDPRPYVKRLVPLPDWQRLRRTPEVVEMVRTILGGSQMGPGEGWFHPGQSRFGWSWLAARHDLNQDGVIAPAEFLGPPDEFRVLDRDADGWIVADDFDWSDRSPFIRKKAQISFWFRPIDETSNGMISRREWEAFFDKATGEKGYLTPDDLRKALEPPPRPITAESSGPSTLTLLVGLYHGELGSWQEGPGIGEPARDFELKTPDGAATIALSSLYSEKPVVLIFGSFT